MYITYISNTLRLSPSTVCTQVFDRCSIGVQFKVSIGVSKTRIPITVGVQFKVFDRCSVRVCLVRRWVSFQYQLL